MYERINKGGSLGNPQAHRYCSISGDCNVQFDSVLSIGKPHPPLTWNFGLAKLSGRDSHVLPHQRNPARYYRASDAIAGAAIRGHGSPTVERELLRYRGIEALSFIFRRGCGGWPFWARRADVVSRVAGWQPSVDPHRRGRIGSSESWMGWKNRPRVFFLLSSYPHSSLPQSRSSLIPPVHLGTA